MSRYDLVYFLEKQIAV